jgi:phospholipid/cholesterol/gamma-HCH transport system substrate-binding protein
METRANSLIVGTFVLLTLAIGVLFAIWLARAGNSGPKKEFFVVFNGSVQGLDKGSYVLFNGLRVGEVADIGINPGNTSEVRGRIVVDSMTPVKRDSTVRLTYAGLTGVASIEVTGGGPRSEILVPGPDGAPPTLYAERSFVQNIMDSGSETLQHINEVVSKVNRLLDENSENVTETINDLRLAVRNIKDLSEQARSKGLVDNLNETAESIRHMADNLDKRVTIISGDISHFTNKGLKELEGLISDGRRTLSSVDETVRDLNRNPQGLIFGRPAVPVYKGQQ